MTQSKCNNNYSSRDLRETKKDMHILVKKSIDITVREQYYDVE